MKCNKASVNRRHICDRTNPPSCSVSCRSRTSPEETSGHSVSFHRNKNRLREPPVPEAPHWNKTNTRPVIKDVTKALSIVSPLSSASESAHIIAQSLAWRAPCLGYERRLVCPHIHPAEKTPQRGRTTLRLQCRAFVLSFIISAADIMKPFKLAVIHIA